MLPVMCNVHIAHCIDTRQQNHFHQSSPQNESNANDSHNDNMHFPIEHCIFQLVLYTFYLKPFTWSSVANKNPKLKSKQMFAYTKQKASCTHIYSTNTEKKKMCEKETKCTQTPKQISTQHKTICEWMAQVTTTIQYNPIH